MALPPPSDSGGEGKQRVGAQAQSNGGRRRFFPRGHPKAENPQEGSESSVRDKQRDRVALWTYGERRRFLHSEEKHHGLFSETTLDYTDGGPISTISS